MPKLCFASKVHYAALRTTPRAQDHLLLTEQNVNQVLQEIKIELGSIFGNSKENRDVGITGDVQLVHLDGPIVVLRLQGRFWHKRADVVRSTYNSIMFSLPLPIHKASES